MPADDSFDRVISRLRGGDQAAAAEILDRFTHRLVGLARRRLDPIRRKVDPEDVLQSVYRSFFLRNAKGQFDFSNWNDVWNMLVCLTLRKCGHRIEYFHAAVRDVRRETMPRPDADSSAEFEALARDPTPAEAAALTETVDELMRQLPDERQRQMLALRLQGYKLAEISGEVGRSEQTVIRVLERVRTRLARHLGTEAEDS